jgi:hypothetical protein
MLRRQFLRIAGASAVGLATASCSASEGFGDTSLSQPDILATLGADVTRRIGSEYRGLHRSEADVHALRNAILASRPISERLVGVPRTTVPALVRADFERGRTVVIDGWILSITEARQCALFSLLRA